MVTVRNSDRPWFNSEFRREIRKRDRIRKTAKNITIIYRQIQETEK